VLLRWGSTGLVSEFGGLAGFCTPVVGAATEGEVGTALGGADGAVAGAAGAADGADVLPPPPPELPPPPPLVCASAGALQSAMVSAAISRRVFMTCQRAELTGVARGTKRRSLRWRTYPRSDHDLRRSALSEIERIAKTRSLAAPGFVQMALELRAPWELGASLAALPLLRRAPRGDGHPVIVFPGLIASDFSTEFLRNYLRFQGYAAMSWGQGRNFGFRSKLMQASRRQIAEVSQLLNRKVSLVGWSLDGIYARELAKQVPGRVRTVITLGTPFTGDPEATNAKRLYDLLNPGAAPSKKDWQSSPNHRRCRRPPSTAEQTVWSLGNAASKVKANTSRISKWMPAISDWGSIPLRCTPSPIGSRNRRTAGSRFAEQACAEPSMAPKTDRMLRNRLRGSWPARSSSASRKHRLPSIPSQSYAASGQRNYIWRDGTSQ
jgi:pimeloyl-ACP methyl ester carboxylesterase